jgi:hypothetical protein
VTVRLLKVVRIISDYPEMVDLRTESQVSALRALANGIGSDKSTVKLPLKDRKTRTH